MTKADKCRRVMALASAAIVTIVAASRLGIGCSIELSVNQMAELAGQVILGEVEQVESFWASDPQRIESRIRFRQVQYLAGAHPGASTTFDLIVPGGTVGEFGMRLCCAPQFEVGQRWMLMLLPTYRTHPVVGMSQGAFRIIADDHSIERVYSAMGEPVIGLNPDHTVRFAPRASSDAPAARTRLTASANLRLSSVKTPHVQAVTAQEWRDAIESVLADRRNQQMTHPAGQRELVTFTPVPLRRAGAATEIHDVPDDRANEPRRCPESQSQSEGSRR